MRLKNKYQKDFEELKPIPPEEIPTYNDIMKKRYEMDSVNVPVKPEIILEEKKESVIMKGWKTWVGIFLIALAWVVRTVLGMPEFGDAIQTLAYLFLGVGIGSKLDKASNSK